MTIRRLLAGTLASTALITAAGCESLPGTRGEQATGAGATAGAAVGAAAMDNSLLGALLGGAAGAAGGHLIGARTDWFEEESGARREAAEASIRESRQSPATVEQVREAKTADLNDDGFVTMDELIAMEQARLSERAIIDRLQDTEQVFELNRQQRQELAEAGLSRALIAEIEEINREERDAVLGRSGVISEPA